MLTTVLLIRAENVHQLFIVIFLVFSMIDGDVCVRVLNIWGFFLDRENKMESLKNFVRYSWSSSPKVRTTVIQELLEALRTNQIDGKQLLPYSCSSLPSP